MNKLHTHAAALQAVAWSMFAVTIVLVLALVKSTVAGVARCVRCWVLGTSALMMATQLVREGLYTVV
jgi:hypothetical protein